MHYIFVILMILIEDSWLVVRFKQLNKKEIVHMQPLSILQHFTSYVDLSI